MMACGRSFQTRGAAAQNTWSPIVEWRVRGTTRTWLTPSAAAVWNRCPPHADLRCISHRFRYSTAKRKTTQIASRREDFVRILSSKLPCNSVILALAIFVPIYYRNINDSRYIIHYAIVGWKLDVQILIYAFTSTYLSCFMCISQHGCTVFIRSTSRPAIAERLRD